VGIQQQRERIIRQNLRDTTTTATTATVSSSSNIAIEMTTIAILVADSTAMDGRMDIEIVPPMVAMEICVELIVQSV
jgi:hypothetical protein